MADEKLEKWREELEEANKYGNIARILEIKGWILAREAQLIEDGILE